MDSSRIIFVGPGIQAYDTEQRAKVSLPGTYTAAAVAGRMACLKPHVSATNKTLRVGGVTARFSSAERERLVRAGVLALQEQSGVTRVIRAVTTCSNPTWKEVTTRRIVDFTKFGVRSACAPFMGLLNNERVRQAMKSTVNGFLADMVDREMLVSYHLSVSATREQQRRGTAIVTVILHPIFSTDYIRVVMQMR
jgi:hypothetical protein